jgi:hypothetical protein
MRTSSISVGRSPASEYFLSISLSLWFSSCDLWLSGTVGCWPVIPSVASVALGRFHRFALNLERRSSNETACLNVRTMVLDVVNGSLRGIRPTELTVSLFRLRQLEEARRKKIVVIYQTPTNSMGTSIENAFLNALDCFHPTSSTLVNIL